MARSDAHRVLARAIRKRRRDLSLTQQQLGDLAGCGRLLVHELEKGKATVRLDKLLDVLTVLGLQLDLRSGVGGIVEELHAAD